MAGGLEGIYSEGIT
jgi:WD40 repeat protein